MNIIDPIIILKENLKQKCIFDYSEKEKDNKIFFNYLYTFYSTCLNATGLIKNFHKVCSEAVMKHLNIPNEIINNCIRDSFDNYDDFKNSENKIYSQNSEDINNYKLNKQGRQPFILINKIEYKVNNLILSKGSLKGLNLLEAICAGFIQKPEICFKSFKFDRSDSGFNILSIITITVIVILINIIIFLMCKRYLNRQIKNEVSFRDFNLKIENVVSNYLKIKEENNINHMKLSNDIKEDGVDNLKNKDSIN